MSTEREQERSPRDGIRFQGKWTKTPDDKVVYHLYVEGAQQPIFSSRAPLSVNAIDDAFQTFIDKDDFSQAPTKEIKAILELYAREKKQGVHYTQKTWRFLNANENEKVPMAGDPKFTFILTKDKSDIIENQ